MTSLDLPENATNKERFDALFAAVREMDGRVKDLERVCGMNPVAVSIIATRPEWTNADAPDGLEGTVASKRGPAYLLVYRERGSELMSHDRYRSLYPEQAAAYFGNEQAPNEEQ